MMANTRNGGGGGKRNVVIDGGSGSFKIGYGGDDGPRFVFPTLTGRPFLPHVVLSSEKKEIFIGQEALQKRGVLNLQNPIKNGVIENFDDYEEIIKTALSEDFLNAPPDQSNLLLTEAPLNPSYNRERQIEILFETFEFSSVYFSIPAILSLYSHGLTTGCVFDSGEGLTQCVPIFEGFVLPHGIARYDFGGRDVTEFLSRLLLAKGFNFRSSRGDLEIAREIKESLAFVALDFEGEMKIQNSFTGTEKLFDLPDGNVIKLGAESFKCAEALFSPAILGKNIPGAHEILLNSVNSCDRSLTKIFYKNVLLTGGNTFFPGFEKRLTKELINFGPLNTEIKILSPPSRKFSAWIGGSILTSLSSFENLWVSRGDYKENGPAAFNKKCFFGEN